MTELQSTKSSKFKGLIIAFIIIGAITATGFYYKQYVIIHYYLMAYSPFKEGDKVYAKDFLVKSASDSMNIDLKQLIRPSNEDDSKNKPYIINSGWEIKSEKFHKAKSTYIGTYVGYKIVHVKREKDYFPALV